MGTGRKIRGCASFPEVDKENELILAEALKAALPHYMKHPILHVQHSERPVGIVERAEFDENGALYIEGSIFDTPENDVVWKDIQEGKLNKFSIFGRRVEGTPECQLPPELRKSPCVTRALELYSISVVGDNAINPKTYLEVAKGGDGTPFGEYEDFKECVSQNQSKDNPEAYCASVHKKITGEWPSEKAEPEPGPEKAEPEEPEETKEPIKCKKSESDISARLAKIEETLAKLVESDKKVHETMKSEEKMEDKETKEPVEKAEPVETVKAEPVPTPDYVVKAVMEDEIRKSISEIQKAYDARFETIEKAYSELRETVEKMKKEKIEKGGNVVVIAREKIEANPRLGNLDILKEVI